MRTFLRWLGRGLLVSVIILVALGLWKREELSRVWAVITLFDEEKIVSNFSNMDAAFLTTPVPRGNGPTAELSYGAETELPPAVDDWITERDVTALVVLKDGAIVYENYFKGTSADDLRISWSMAKSYLSALVGILLDEGQIDSIDDPVTKYAPELAGGAYDGSTLRDVLQMSSGVVFNEDYLDFFSDIQRMGRVLAFGREMDDFAAALTETYIAPGTEWKYVSIDTHVVGMVVRGATGRSVTDLLSERIIIPLGVEYAPYYVTDGVGTAFVLGGLNFTTRDYARFGQMYLQQGQWQGQQIVPADWVDASTAPSAPTAPGKIGYGYQWWIPQGADPGTYMARGIYGQYIYVDTGRGVVIATNGADRKFREDGVSQQNVDIFRTIAESL
ncbi:serine hydrolase domain-containing protein [Sulfitobacter aestuariivivens]|uniref:Serine hydrolase n=1 Tax=Sulfitobacter aestuariivivens TaxID=2766981 RepID=A0A927D3Z7_9RHOB|nr:serine hydrolase [Sulfitobacter aestuariivivens]MBD3663951.1 serine hydrolase [Sulfitobacter aestuariivivens]